jgi:hypothetical protein
MSEKLKLICTLKRHIISDEGDFIPEGTPVQVIGWADDSKSIEVRSSAYMYCDHYSIDAVVSGKDTGAVGSGLFLSVPPDALAYSDETHAAMLADTWAD